MVDMDVALGVGAAKTNMGGLSGASTSFEDRKNFAGAASDRIPDREDADLLRDTAYLYYINEALAGGTSVHSTPEAGYRGTTTPEAGGSYRGLYSSGPLVPPPIGCGTSATGAANLPTRSTGGARQSALRGKVPRISFEGGATSAHTTPETEFRAPTSARAAQLSDNRGTRISYDEAPLSSGRTSDLAGGAPSNHRTSTRLHPSPASGPRATGAARGSSSNLQMPSLERTWSTSSSNGGNINRLAGGGTTTSRSPPPGACGPSGSTSMPKRSPGAYLFYAVTK